MYSNIHYFFTFVEPTNLYYTPSNAPLIMQTGFYTETNDMLVNTLNINSNYIGQMTLTIFAVDGKQVYKNDLFKETNTISFDTHSLPSGFYFVELMNEINSAVSVKKVIKS